ncbi:hypothetical protein [Galbibacter mesophilus]|uniref:hypothetical protein n=1 Tax=Galbibacter mesophilus TaxID=379069 RepID=UPI00191EDC00|nr:hypothetical protein [Galbibacter mesophilus]MCM5664015.1 hypothetical protein [Galbibacter mesophilus]
MPKSFDGDILKGATCRQISDIVTVWLLLEKMDIKSQIDFLGFDPPGNQIPAKKDLHYLKVFFG